jgi:outer membrane protein
MKRIALILAVGMILVPSVTNAGEWVVRLRAINISPNESSGQIGDTGSEVAVDSATVPEVDITYMMSPNFGLELIAAVADHDLAAAGGALNGADLGTVSILPPTLVLQWHPFPGGLFDFYVGAGVNYTNFYDYDLSETLASIDVTDIGFDSSFGLAGDVGLSVFFGDHFHLNGDIKYIQISTDAEIRTADGVLDTVSVDIDPWVFGLGVGWKF